MEESKMLPDSLGKEKAERCQVKTWLDLHPQAAIFLDIDRGLPYPQPNSRAGAGDF
jgi:hypothetical protein